MSDKFHDENHMFNFEKQTTRASKQKLGSNTKQTITSNFEATSW
jgi:hypothetical protein